MADDHAPHGASSSAANLASGLETMKANLAAVIAESQALRNDVKVAEAGRKRASAIATALLALLVVLVGMGIVITAQNNQTVHKVNEVAQQMADCTTAGGHCYQQGNERYSQAIADVIRAELFMAECARLFPGEVGPTYDAKLESCVYGRLAKAAAERANPPRNPLPSPSAAASPR